MEYIVHALIYCEHMKNCGILQVQASANSACPDSIFIELYWLQAGLTDTGIFLLITLKTHEGQQISDKET